MSGNSGNENQTTTTEPWQAQQPYLQDLFAAASQYFNAPRPDIGPSQELGRQGIGQLTAAVPQTQGLASSAANANQFLLGDVLSPDSNPALQQYIDLSNNAITRQFTEGINPALQSGALAGGVPTSRQGIAQGIAGGRTSEAVQANTAQLANQGYQGGLDAYVRGLALAPQTTALQQAPADLYFRAAGAQYDVDNAAAAQNLQYLQNYQQLISGNLGSTVTSPNPYQGLSPWQGALGGAATGYSVGGWYGAAAGAILGYMSTQ